MKKARIAEFLKDYWDVRKGNSQMRQNGTLKTIEDIGQAIGEDRRNTQRLLKLNDLIPELQQLVSNGKLGTTAAEQLAYLSPEVQRALYALHHALEVEIFKTDIIPDRLKTWLYGLSTRSERAYRRSNALPVGVTGRRDGQDAER